VVWAIRIAFRCTPSISSQLASTPARRHSGFAAKADGVWGDGSAQRDFMYVKDAARVGLAIMNNIIGSSNIGSGTVYRIRDIVAMIADISGMADKIEWDATKPNGQDYRAYDLSKIDSIGFKCHHTNRQGLEETWGWYSAQMSRDAR
jgi:GDP-L-fucose synthase